MFSQHSRRDFLKLSLASIPAVCLAKAWAASPAAASRPNIIYFVCHDLGRAISPYGAQVATPNLHAFAEQGMVLNNAYCSSPACAPSRGCAMTGRYAHKTGLMGVNELGNPDLWQLGPDEKTIVNYLNEAGYMTVHCGFQHERHFGKLPKDAPNPNGYQVDSSNDWPSCFVEKAVDDALGWLKKRDPKDQQPFYLNIGTQECHASITSGDLGKKYNRPAVYGGPDPEDQVWIPPDFPDNKTSRETLSTFWPCVRFVDQEFGRLVREIDALGYGDNTIVVFTTDHGISGPRHKGRVYDGGMEIATIIRQPGAIAAGSRSDNLIANVDFCPTLLEAADAAVPQLVDGRSFWPMLAGGKYEPSQIIFTERNYHQNYDPMRAARTKDLLYIRNFHPRAKRFYTAPETLTLPAPQRDGWPNIAVEGVEAFTNPALHDWPLRDREELYDLRKDPMQFNNVASDPDYASELRTLSAALEAWMVENDDVLLKGAVSHGTGTLT
jgi:arylsulfatase A-like enzyme